MVPADFMWLEYGTLVEDYVRLCEGGADGVYTFNCCCETIGNPSFVEAIHAVAHDQDSLQTGVEWPRNLRRSGHRPTQDQHPCRRRYALRGNADPTPHVGRTGTPQTMGYRLKGQACCDRFLTGCSTLSNGRSTTQLKGVLTEMVDNLASAIAVQLR